MRCLQAVHLIKHFHGFRQGFWIHTVDIIMLLYLASFRRHFSSKKCPISYFECISQSDVAINQYQAFEFGFFYKHFSSGLTSEVLYLKPGVTNQLFRLLHQHLSAVNCSCGSSSSWTAGKRVLARNTFSLIGEYQGQVQQ